MRSSAQVVLGRVTLTDILWLTASAAMKTFDKVDHENRPDNETQRLYSSSCHLARSWDLSHGLSLPCQSVNFFISTLTLMTFCISKAIPSDIDCYMIRMPPMSSTTMDDDPEATSRVTLKRVVEGARVNAKGGRAKVSKTKQCGPVEDHIQQSIRSSLRCHGLCFDNLTGNSCYASTLYTQKQARALSHLMTA